MPSPPTETADESACFHCGLPVLEPGRWSAVVDGRPRPMCCAGCEAVAGAIVAAGLDDYYRHRSGPASKVAAVPPELEQLSLYDDAQVQAGFAREAGDGAGTEVSLAIEGMRCGACVWLLERTLAAEPGVLAASVNFATERAVVRWDPAATRLSTLLARFREVGYGAVPYDPKQREEAIVRTSKAMFRRLFVAGIAMMQVMMYAFPAYITAPGEIEPAYDSLMRWASFVLTVPVVLYSATPFFAGAWRDLRARSPGMDVPVAIGIGVAFAASAWATVTGRGEVYFDSVTMFVFLLLGSRYLEWIARRRAGRALDAITSAAPERVARLGADGGEESVPAIRLAPGDRIRVDGGERIAVDAILLEGRGAVDLALLTGESVPVPVVAGDEVPGGAVNAGTPLTLEVLRETGRSTLSTIERLIERSAEDKPRLSRIADRVAGVFVSALLVFSLLVFGVWLVIDPARAAPVAIAVLVVSCPCALSMATPTALAAATGSLLRRHILITRGHTLESLTNCTDVVFDKTGTLTEGRPEVIAMQPAPGRDPAELLAWAAALETGSAHPFARAIITAAGDAGATLLPDDRHDEPGFGVSASLRAGDGSIHRLLLGSAAWCGIDEDTAAAQRAAPPAPVDAWRPDAARCDEPDAGDRASDVTNADALAGASEVFLVERLDGDDGRDGYGKRIALARIAIADAPRPEAAALVASLGHLGLRTHLLSGDREPAVAGVARALGIGNWRAQADPGQKLAFVRGLRESGARVLMVGDGINDAPVLAAADASIAVGRASALARSAADAIILAPSITGVGELMATARRTRRIMTQNLGWAAAYNATAIPVAAFGLVPPWAAAIGMALSSLAVALNATRLWQWNRSSS
jgi:Cu2+-exporting ATPase